MLNNSQFVDAKVEVLAKYSNVQWKRIAEFPIERRLLPGNNLTRPFLLRTATHLQCLKPAWLNNSVPDAAALVVSSMKSEEGVYDDRLSGRRPRPARAHGRNRLVVGAALALAEALCYSELGVNSPRFRRRVSVPLGGLGPGLELHRRMGQLLRRLLGADRRSAMGISAYLSFFFPIAVRRCRPGHLASASCN